MKVRTSLYAVRLDTSLRRISKSDWIEDVKNVPPFALAMEMNTELWYVSSLENIFVHFLIVVEKLEKGEKR